MTTNEFIDAVKSIGYKVNQSDKNVARRKHKLQITRVGQRHPIAWVFTNEMYSMRSLGVDDKTYDLLVEYSRTPLNER